MSASRLMVLTPQGKSEIPREFLTDRDRFPAEALTTTDLAKARHWKHPVGMRRFRKRNSFASHYRGVWVDEMTIKAAAALDKTAGATAPTAAPAKSKPAPRKHSARSVKTDPNKRTRRANRKRAIRAIRRAAEKPRRTRRKIKAAA